MLTIFTYYLRRLLGQVIGWGMTFFLLALYLMSLYQPMAGQQAQLQSLMEAYGENFLAFFGGMGDFLSPAGFLDFSFFSYMSVVAGIFAVISGAGMLMADEEKGMLDLVMAYPVSRTKLFWGRFMALLLANVSILLLTWLGFAIGIPIADWEVNLYELLQPHIALLALLLLFGGLATFLSFILPSRTLAASLSAGLLIVSYFVTSLVRVSDRLEKINNLSPLKYYQGGRALDGLNWEYFWGLLGFGLLFFVLAWLLFLRRDVRVSGEGGWGLTRLSKRQQEVA